MREDLRPGDLVTRLAITGTTSEISTRLSYNSSEVQTNGTNYFRLNFTDLYLTSSRSFSPIDQRSSSCPLALDYEWWTANNYSNPFRFIVECTILSDRTVVLVDFQLVLNDVNDNPPRFTQSIYRVNITESTPINTIVSTDIVAYDIDSRPNALFFYYLVNDSSPYSVGDEQRCSSRSILWRILVVFPFAQRDERESRARQSIGLQRDGFEFEPDHCCPGKTWEQGHGCLFSIHLGCEQCFIRDQRHHCHHHYRCG